ncbi:methyltransferase domain-containing protein [Candidatus Kaiserbacteria bacterium]|nr:methyltransferase domain-containing protein [Candidatus Kaiserbacteria bacterium]
MQFVVPENVATHFHLRDGDAVGDFGAGSGFFEKALSKMVGKTGKVYVCEIQKALIERIASLLDSEKIDNAEVLWCDIETPDGCKLKDGILDAGILSNTLFQLDNKASALEEIRRLLRKGGKFFVLDWSDKAPGIGPAAVVPEDKAQALVEQHHFRFVRSFPAGEHHYGLAFQAV